MIIITMKKEIQNGNNENLMTHKKIITAITDFLINQDIIDCFYI